MYLSYFLKLFQCSSSLSLSFRKWISLIFVWVTKPCLNFLLSCTCVYVTFMYMFTCGWVDAHESFCMCRPKIDSLVTLCLKYWGWLSVETSFTDSAILATQLSLGIQLISGGHQACLNFTWMETLNSHPHSCLVSALPIESFPQLLFIRNLVC